MAIQMRRGSYTNFDATKLLPGEVTVVLSGDPFSSDGVGIYFCHAAGSVKRLASFDEIETEIANIGRITEAQGVEIINNIFS